MSQSSDMGCSQIEDLFYCHFNIVVLLSFVIAIFIWIYLDCAARDIFNRSQIGLFKGNLSRLDNKRYWRPLSLNFEKFLSLVIVIVIFNYCHFQ